MPSSPSPVLALFCKTLSLKKALPNENTSLEEASVEASFLLGCACRVAAKTIGRLVGLSEDKLRSLRVGPVRSADFKGPLALREFYIYSSAYSALSERQIQFSIKAIRNNYFAGKLSAAHAKAKANPTNDAFFRLADTYDIAIEMLDLLSEASECLESRGKPITMRLAEKSVESSAKAILCALDLGASEVETTSLALESVDRLVKGSIPSRFLAIARQELAFLEPSVNLDSTYAANPFDYNLSASEQRQAIVVLDTVIKELAPILLGSLASSADDDASRNRIEKFLKDLNSVPPLYDAKKATLANFFTPNGEAAYKNIAQILHLLFSLHEDLRNEGVSAKDMGYKKIQYPLNYSDPELLAVCISFLSLANSELREALLRNFGNYNPHVLTAFPFSHHESLVEFYIDELREIAALALSRAAEISRRV
jgi:hypothetical protein